MEHLIRLGDTLDLYDIIKIEKESFNVGNENRNKPLFIALKQKNIYVYTVGFEITGYILIKINSKKNTAYIDSLAIGQPFRKKGYAKALMNFIIDILKQKNIISCNLHVYTRNKMAIDMYKKLGFEKINYINKHYGIDNNNNSIDAYLMEIRL